MQSAFVDLGLERDAFLYVTDFLELEDQEEAEELEKAAVAGGAQPPREVRHGNGQQAPRQDRQGRGDRDRRAAEIPAAPAAEPEIPALTSHVEEDAEQPAEGGRRWRGRRRRRGGRATPVHVADPVETEASAETYLEPSEIGESDMAPEIQAAGAVTETRGVPTDRSSSVGWPSAEPAAPAPAHPHRPERGASHFVLPGESLSKYGGTEAPRAEAQPAPPPRPVSNFKPATLIEKPIEWDGSGLLPGESLSRHRRHEPEPETSTGLHGEPQGVFADAALAEPSEELFLEETLDAPFGAAIEGTEAGPDDELDSEDLVMEEQPEETLPGASAELQVPEVTVRHPADQDLSAGTPVPEPVVNDPFASDPFFINAPGYAQEEHSGEPQEASGWSNMALNPTEPVIHEPDAEEAIAEPTHVLTTDPDRPEAEPCADERIETERSEELEGDRSASHHVDPLRPSEFRLSSLFGGKKKSDEPVAPPPALEPARTEPQASTVKSVSAFAPGAGLVEEEVIEGEEIELPRHHHKMEEHDLDEYEEEEKTHTQIRSGELGEMLQEAHLDHRIQMNFEDKGAEVEGDEVFDIEEDEDEEEEAAEQETVPAGNGAPAPAQPRRERGGRGRRGGRGPQQGAGRRGGPSRRSAQTSDLPIISDLLKPGQEILVQIAKEPIAKKGARITSHIALPGRFLVFMPTVNHVGVSRKIASEEERHRLKRILTSERGEASGGFIVRTAAEGASEEELRSDLRFLIHLWEEIKQRSENSKSPALIYHDLSLIERILRDQMSANFSSIWVDSEADYERIVRFLNRFAPGMVRRVKLYTKETPLFEHFGIQDEISKALRSKVWLKSGGSIVINQTEALVAIDINTGKYVGKTARLEDTIVKTNLDAIPEIVRQIRLRDLGGIIIIDFIDMDERKNRFKVMGALEEALKNDRAPTKVLQFNDFGLVAITRKRVKQSLERTLSVPCLTCQATGMVKSPSTVANEIYIELRKMRRHFENADVVLRVHPETVKVLKANNAHWLTDFEELIGKNILVKSDPALHPEQFDIQG